MERGARSATAPTGPRAGVHCSFTRIMGLCGPGRRLGLRALAPRRVLSGANGFSPGQDGREFDSMRTILALSLALAAAVSVSACQTPQQQNAAVGGALGAGTGALVGSAVSGGSAGGTLAGAAIGAGTGALIGSAATPQPTYYGAPPPRRCAQWAYDYNGNRVCTAVY